MAQVHTEKTSCALRADKINKQNISTSRLFVKQKQQYIFLELACKHINYIKIPRRSICGSKSRRRNDYIIQFCN